MMLKLTDGRITIKCLEFKTLASIKMRRRVKIHEVIRITINITMSYEMNVTARNAYISKTWIKNSTELAILSDFVC